MDDPGAGRHVERRRAGVVGTRRRHVPPTDAQQRGVAVDVGLRGAGEAPSAGGQQVGVPGHHQVTGEDPFEHRRERHLVLGGLLGGDGPGTERRRREHGCGTEEHELCEPTPWAQPSLSPHALTLGVEPTLTNHVERTPAGGRGPDAVHAERTATASSTSSTRCESGGHRTAGGEGREQRPGRHEPGPVLDPDEHHRGHRRLVGVVVLAGVLEHLLHRAGGAGEEHDAAVAAPHERRLAHGVLEVLGDRRGEHVGRLVAVEPGRDAEPAVTAGPPPAHVERHPGPRRDRRPVRRHRRQHVDGVVERLVGVPGQARRRG